MTFMTILGAWVAVGLTLFIFSFLYRDNPLFKLAEHLYIGITVGYSLAITIFNVWVPKVYEPLIAFNFWPLVPALLGLCVLARFFEKISWLSRYGFAVIMGWASGLAIPVVLSSFFITQLEGTIQPIFNMGSNGIIFSGLPVGKDPISLIILALGVFTTLFYFFFSIEHTGIGKKTAKVGIYFLMIYFGAAFGATVMGRFALLYGRFVDLYTFKSATYYYATPILLVLVVASLAYYGFRLAASEKK